MLLTGGCKELMEGLILANSSALFIPVIHIWMDHSAVVYFWIIKGYKALSYYQALKGKFVALKNNCLKKNLVLLEFQTFEFVPYLPFSLCVLSILNGGRQPQLLLIFILSPLISFLMSRFIFLFYSIDQEWFI